MPPAWDPLHGAGGGRDAGFFGLRRRLRHLRRPPGEKGFIRVAVSRQRELLSILFENSRALSQEITPGKDGLPATTKGEGPYHGYGLGNLKRAVEHYQGALLWEAPPGLFRLKILLSIPPVGE